MTFTQGSGRATNTAAPQNTALESSTSLPAVRVQGVLRINFAEFKHPHFPRTCDFNEIARQATAGGRFRIESIPDGSVIRLEVHSYTPPVYSFEETFGWLRRPGWTVEIVTERHWVLNAWLNALGGGR